MKKNTILIFLLMFATVAFGQFRGNNGVFETATSLNADDVFIIGVPGSTNRNLAAANALPYLFAITAAIEPPPAFSGTNLTALPANAALRTRTIGASARIFNVASYGAVGDDTTDDTDAINNAIDAAKAATGGIVYFPFGNYKVRKKTSGAYNGCLQLNQASNIVFLGDGPYVTKIRNTEATDNNTSVVYIKDSHRIGFVGLTVDGGAAIPARAAFASSENEGLCFAFVTNCFIRDVIITNVLADGFDGDWNVNLRVENLQAYNCGNTGIKPNGYDISMHNLRVANCGYNGSDFDRGGLGLMDCYETSVSQLFATNNLYNIMISASRSVVVDNFYLRTDSNSRTNIFMFGGNDVKLKGGHVVGGYGIYTTNNIGGTAGPSLLKVEDVSFWTVQGLFAFTPISDFSFVNVSHFAANNPYGAGSGQGFYFHSTVDRGSFINCNMRSGSSNIRWAGTFHNVVIANNIFGTHVGSAIYGTGGSAVATNLAVMNNSFQQAGANSISMSESAAMWGNTFSGNVMKGVMILAGGTNDIINNKLLAGFTLTGSNCRSNWINGNRVSATVTFTTTTGPDQIWGINAGDGAVTTYNP